MTFLPEDIISKRSSAFQSNSEVNQPLDNLVDLLLEIEQDRQEQLSVKNGRELGNNEQDRDRSSQSPELSQKIEFQNAVDDNFNQRQLKTSDLEVKFAPKTAKNFTFNEAVEYEAFLSQTAMGDRTPAKSEKILVESHHLKNYLLSEETETKVREENNLLITNSTSSPQPSEEQLAEIKETLADENLQVEDLADTINTLIPLIVELLKYKAGDTRESILRAVVPIIDRIIEQRSVEDAPKMAAAIAKILPDAISEEIKISPQAIARAIAPEVALAIEEQIRLDRDAISNALGSEMGKAIKTQIELEKDAMVDALYPVIGNTISKYMIEVVHEINNKVENALSLEGFKRKIRAKIQGVSEAELILLEAVNYQVQAVFLIDKDSGLIIQEVQPDSQQHLQSDLVAGMLTAIRSFANDCIASGSELDTIDYGDWQIPIEVGGYCYIAVVVKGEPSKKFRTKIRQTLSKIILKYGNEIQNYNGDPATVPEAVQTLLIQLVELDNPESELKSAPTTLIWLSTIILGMMLIPWGIVSYRRNVAHSIERETAIQLDAAPELSVYLLEPEVHREKLTLVGRVPNEYLRSQAAKVVQPIADRANLQLDNQIIAVNVPVDLSATTGEIQRLTSLFNQQPNIAISTQYQAQTLTITGFILNEQELKTVYTTFKEIPGVKTVIVAVDKQLPSFNERIYFKKNSAQLNPANQGDSLKINNVKVFLKRYPQLNLRLIAHSDRQGTLAHNQKLSQARLHNVRTKLIAEGVDPARLKLEVSDTNPPDVEDDGPLWLSRCVRFESFIPTNRNN